MNNPAAKEAVTYVEESPAFLAAAGSGHPSPLDTATSSLSVVDVEGLALSPIARAALRLAARPATLFGDDRDEDEDDVYLQLDIRRAMELSLQPADTPTIPTPGASGTSTRAEVPRQREASAVSSVADAIPTVAVAPPAGPKIPAAVDVVPVPSGPSSVAVPTPRVVPDRLKHLRAWLLANSTPGTALKLANAYLALFPMLQNNELYLGVSAKQRWSVMLGEAVEHGLIELINMTVAKKLLKARGEAQMIRLLERGFLQYTNTYPR